MKLRPSILLCLLLSVAGVASWALVRHAVRPAAEPAPDSPAGRPATRLSDLATEPDWAALNAFQSTLTRSDFLREMDDIFTVSPAWRQWFEVGEQEVLIHTGPGENERFRLRFAPEETGGRPPRSWRTPAELPPAPADRPLEGLKIAIDPGHIGGRWAKMEERWFQMAGGTPVTEGGMTLIVAKLLKPKLEALGAQVTLVRETTEPVTDIRPEMLHDEAARLSGEPGAGDLSRLAQRLFYRTAEIRARARLVNETLRPDLVLCLHFNADAWGNPEKPLLSPGHHFHMILNGAYTDEEIGMADQRYELTRKIVQGIHGEETALAESVAAAFVELGELPPYTYSAAARTSRNVAGNPYLWARNLLANRLYDCPVVYFEPYVMNSTVDYPRIQAGDYEGTREIDGRPRPSIFREYADATVLGLERYYREHRAVQ